MGFGMIAYLYSAHSKVGTLAIEAHSMVHLTSAWSQLRHTPYAMYFVPFVDLYPDSAWYW